MKKLFASFTVSLFCLSSSYAMEADDFNDKPVSSPRSSYLGEKTLDELLEEENYGKVTVNLWKPEGQNIGHASLSTNKHYISLWPMESDKKARIFNPVTAVLVRSYDLDKKKEDGKEAIKYELILNQRNINNVFEEFLKYNEFQEAEDDDGGQYYVLSKTKWILRGFPPNKTIKDDNLFDFPHSCVTFALIFLRLGKVQGIDEGLESIVKAFRQFNAEKNVEFGFSIKRFLFEGPLSSILKHITSSKDKDEAKTDNQVAYNDNNFILSPTHLETFVKLIHKTQEGTRRLMHSALSGCDEHEKKELMEVAESLIPSFSFNVGEGSNKGMLFMMPTRNGNGPILSVEKWVEHQRNSEKANNIAGISAELIKQYMGLLSIDEMCGEEILFSQKKHIKDEKNIARDEFVFYYEEILPIIEKYISLGSKYAKSIYAESLADYGQALLNKSKHLEDIKESIKLYQKALEVLDKSSGKKVTKQHHNAYFSLSRRYAELGLQETESLSYDKAINSFKEAIQYHSKTKEYQTAAEWKLFLANMKNHLADAYYNRYITILKPLPTNLILLKEAHKLLKEVILHSSGSDAATAKMNLETFEQFLRDENIKL